MTRPHRSPNRRGTQHGKYNRAVGLAVGVLALTLAACGSSSSSRSGGAPTPSISSGSSTTVHVAQVARATPSTSARMICAPEAKRDIGAALNVDTIAPLHPTWSPVDHIYACDYQYAGGARIAMSVKEMSSKTETTAYFDSLAQRLGRDQNLDGLGQGAFTTKGGSVVVRKDYKVLLVDTSRLPTQFGEPPESRANVGTTIAATIMGCWTGA
jgi:hypothetical protein